MQRRCWLVSVAVLGDLPSIQIEHIVVHPLVYLRWKWRGRHVSFEPCRDAHCAQVLRRGHVVAVGVAVSVGTILVVGKRIVMHTLPARYVTMHDVIVVRLA